MEVTSNMEEKEAQGCKYSNLQVTPDHLDFVAKEGTRYLCASQRLYIKKAGGVGVLDTHWTINLEGQASEAGFLKVKPLTGRGRQTLHVSADPRGLPGGSWTVMIEVKTEVEGVTITPSVIPAKLTVEGKPPGEPEEPEEPPKEPEEPEEPEEPVEPPKEPPPPPVEPPVEPPGKGCWLWRLLKKLGYFLVKVYPRERAK